MTDAAEELQQQIRSCTICTDRLPVAPRPIVQLHSDAKLLIAGQAPGSRVHATGVPFDDPSGDRLRDWIGIDRDTFYDATRVAIAPMGFCYPGTGKHGDRPPLKICSETWRSRVMDALPHVKLTLVIGQYAMAWHLPDRGNNLTETVRSWRNFDESIMPLPHPSPRNNIWLSKNRWFEDELLPVLRQRCRAALHDKRKNR